MYAVLRNARCRAVQSAYEYSEAIAESILRMSMTSEQILDARAQSLVLRH